MTQRIIGEYVKEPITNNEMTAEEQYQWYLLIKQNLHRFTQDNELAQAIADYEKRHNIK